jgi:hypothetical protein
MTLFIIMVPLMVAAVAVATVPVLFHSVREHRLIHADPAERPTPDVDNGHAVRQADPGRPAVHRVRPSDGQSVAA